MAILLDRVSHSPDWRDFVLDARRQLASGDRSRVSLALAVIPVSVQETRICGPISPDAVVLVGSDGCRLAYGTTVPWDAAEKSPDLNYYACLENGQVVAFFAP